MSQIARRLDAHDARMTELLAELTRAWWAMGQECLDVAADRSFTEGGFKSVFEWAERRHGLKRDTAVKAMAVATHFSAEMAVRYGSEKLASTLHYLETTQKVEQAGQVTGMKFRVHRDGKFASIPYDQASYRDIDAARALVERSRLPKPTPLDPSAEAQAAAIEALLEPLPRGASRGRRVELHRDADGQARLTIRSIPYDGLEGFARDLLAQVTQPPK